MCLCRVGGKSWDQSDKTDEFVDLRNGGYDFFPPDFSGQQNFCMKEANKNRWRQSMIKMRSMKEVFSPTYIHECS